MEFLDVILREKRQGNTVVIPDIKCYSPKEGDLLAGRDPVQVAKSLVDAGAKVLSVVTEEKEFHGSLALLKRLKKATGVPLLRKDFIHTKEDLEETKKYGASAILLMCSCLEPSELEMLYHEALALGLDPFVETHSKKEMEQAKALGAKLIGINNRNILELEKDDGDVNTTCALAHFAPKDAVLVSESSIQNSHEVRLALEAGADCALVGTSIWQAKNPAYFYRSLIRKTQVKLCGMMRQEDVDLCMTHGVDIMGFVAEYPKGLPWQLTREQAKPLIERVPSIYQTCVVTGGETEHIVELAKELQPVMVQIHYKESIQAARVIIKELHKLGIRVMKPFPVSREQSLELYQTADKEQVVDMLCDAGLDVLLVDAREASNVTKTNLTLDDALYKEVKEILSKKKNAPKIYVAGGIRPQNVHQVIQELQPDCVDIMSGAEAAPGVKDAAKIKQIIDTINGLQRR